MEENIYIPDGWTISSFGDNNFKIIGSGVKYFENSKYYLSTSSIERDNVLFVEEEITFKDRPSRANMQPIENSIWFAKMKNTLKIFYPERNDLTNVILSTGFCGIYSSDVEISLIKQILLSKSFNSQKDLLAEGSTQEAVNNFKVKQIKFLLPKNRKEQLKIAEILSKVDKAISETEIIIAKYNRIKTGLMQDLLTKGIDEKGNIRSEETHEFKDSPIGRIPKDWDVLKLWEIGSKKSPYLKTGPFGSSLKTEHWVDEGIPVITIGSLGNDDFIQENLLFISEKKADELFAYKLIQDDILFSRVAEIGRSLVIKQKQSGWIMSSNFMRLRLDQNTYLSDFIYLLIKYSNAFQKQITENVNESGRSVTNSGILNSFIFPKVEINEQRKILEKINLINDFLNNLKIELNKLKSTKKGLMQDLLSGKKRVTHLKN